MTTTYQALRDLDDAALTRYLLAGLPRQADNEARLARARQPGSWHMRMLSNGQRVEVRRPDGPHSYLVAGWPGALTSDPAAPFACSCPDGRYRARYGIRCQHVWGRILAALGRVSLDPAGDTDLLLLWGGSASVGTPAPVTTTITNSNEERTMSNNWQDREYQHGDDTSSYPYIQWVNNGGNLNPRQPMGGFAAPIDQDLAIPGTFAHLHHKNGDHTEVIYSPTLTVAVIATRFAWFKDGYRVGAYENGARGTVHALGRVKTEDGPKTAMLTFTGMTSKHFGAARKAHLSQVRKATQGKAPSWAFWMTIKADGTEMVGRTAQSSITKLALAGEVNPDADYIGHDQADIVEALLDAEAPAWVNVWSKPGSDANGNSDDDATGNGGTGNGGTGNGNTGGNSSDAYQRAALPANQKGYRTVGDAEAANDTDTLEKAHTWATGQGHTAVADACSIALRNMATAASETETDALPF